MSPVLSKCTENASQAPVKTTHFFLTFEIKFLGWWSDIFLFHFSLSLSLNEVTCTDAYI